MTKPQYAQWTYEIILYDFEIENIFVENITVVYYYLLQNWYLFCPN